MAKEDSIADPDDNFLTQGSVTVSNDKDDPLSKIQTRSANRHAQSIRKSIKNMQSPRTKLKAQKIQQDARINENK